MKNQSIWKLKSADQKYPTLENDIHTEVAIIGGGITGISTALLLAQQGIETVVLEAREIGKGTTGNSTGNLYSLIESGLSSIEEKYDLTTLQRVVDSRKKALNFIKNNIENFQIDCDYNNRSMFYFDTDNNLNLNKERKLALEVGITTTLIKDENFPFRISQGLEFKNQAQMNPLAYVQGLAKEVHNLGGKIYENSNVTNIVEEENQVILTTPKASVKAKKIIQATHTPKGLQIQYHTTLGPYREYGIAAILKNDNYPQGIFWGFFRDKKYSIRSYQFQGENYLICIGNMHKVGQADDNLAEVLGLKDFINYHFEVEEITHHWGGQNYKPADMLPYIGKKKSNSRQYIATGFSTDGLVYGSLAALILSDEIIGRKNVFWNLYKAYRHRPLKVAKNFTKENLNVASKLIGDFLKSGQSLDLKKMMPEQGKIINYNSGKIAIYKSKSGDFKFLSPICPHMGCTVRWNNADKSWDCPCHGSRFDTNGCVIEGPALKGLKGK